MLPPMTARRHESQPCASGGLCLAQAHEAGAWAAATSVLLKPLAEHVLMELVHGLRQLVPDAVLPSATDDAQTLRTRLSGEAFLHPSWVVAAQLFIAFRCMWPFRKNTVNR